MKTFFRILLSALLILSFSCPAFAAIEMSDKTYEAGKTYTLAEEKIDLSGLYVYAPAHALEELGFPASDQEGLVQVGTYEEIFAEEPLTLKFASDDLSTLMFDNMVCLRDGKLIITYPSFTRGVEDTYGVFERVTNSAYFLRSASRSGMTFSSDGRYALYIDGYSALTRAQFDYQLFILDVEAGEWYLGYTWPRKKITEGAEYVVGACFDETNEYIYIKAYGGAYGDIQSLLRYHIETETMEHLNSNNLWSAYGNMFRTPDGTYVYELSPRQANQPGGLVEYKEIGGKWFAVPSYYHVSVRQVNVQNLEVNSKTGQALVLNTIFHSNPDYDALGSVARQTNALSLPVLNDGIHHLRELIWFDQDMNHASRISAQEYIAREIKGEKKYLNHPILINAALSPDGKYAFLIFYHIGGDSAFFARILNIETLGVSPVSFEEGDIGLKAGFGNAMGADYPVGIRFIANDLIIINTDDGIRLFRIR